MIDYKEFDLQFSLKLLRYMIEETQKRSPKAHPMIDNCEKYNEIATQVLKKYPSVNLSCDHIYFGRSINGTEGKETPIGIDNETFIVCCREVERELGKISSRIS